MSALFLSPHPDDVALSCPARVATAPGAVVVTVFSECGGETERRRAEDEDSCRQLGAQRLALGFADAPVRDAGLASFAGLLFTPLAAQQPVLEALVVALERLLAARGEGEVWAPLGVGGHLDHRLVHAAARRVVPPERLRLWVDLPYGAVPGAVAMRLGLPFDAEALRAGWEAQPLIRRHAPPGAFAGLLAANEAVALPPGFVLEERRFPLELRMQALASLGSHRSQLDELFDVGFTPEAMWQAGVAGEGHRERAYVPTAKR